MKRPMLITTILISALASCMLFVGCKNATVATDTADTQSQHNGEDASDKLISFRREMEGYLDESFAPISAYGENAALPHYSATPEKCSVLQPRGLYLIDSGAHYLDGSTDITRTVPLGPLTDDEAADYTCVLQGMIALSLVPA